MTEENFLYWLQGYFEISGETTFTIDQLRIVEDHLKLIPDSPIKEVIQSKILDPKFLAGFIQGQFTKVTPEREPTFYGQRKCSQPKTLEDYPQHFVDPNGGYVMDYWDQLTQPICEIKTTYCSKFPVEETLPTC